MSEANNDEDAFFDKLYDALTVEPPALLTLIERLDVARKQFIVRGSYVQANIEPLECVQVIVDALYALQQIEASSATPTRSAEEREAIDHAIFLMQQAYKEDDFPEYAASLGKWIATLGRIRGTDGSC